MARKKPLSVTAACVASFVVTLLFQVLFPAQELGRALLLEVACAAVVVLFLLLSCSKQTTTQQAEVTDKNDKLTVLSLVLVVLAGVIQGVPSWVALANAPNASTLLNNVPLISAVVLLCFATGLYEEGLFRGLFVSALQERFKDKRSMRFWVCAFASILFAALHVSWVGPLPASPEEWVLATFKPVQAFAFSWCLCLVVLRGGGVGPCVVVHGLFDVFALGALFSITQSADTLAPIGMPAQTAALLASVVVLVVTIVLLERGTLKRLDANLKEGT